MTNRIHNNSYRTDPYGTGIARKLETVIGLDGDVRDLLMARFNGSNNPPHGNVEKIKLAYAALADLDVQRERLLGWISRLSHNLPQKTPSPAS